MSPAVRRGLWLFAAAAALAALALPKLPTSRSKDAGEGQRAARSAPAVVEVHTVEPEAMVETLATSGTLYANERVEVVSEIAGKLESILFDEGARVQAGDLLMKIDDRELVAAHQRVAARLDLATGRAERQHKLHEDGLISEQEYETAASEATALRAELAEIEARLSKTEIRAPFGGVVGLRRVSVGAYVSPQTRLTTLLDTDPVKLEFAVPERYTSTLRPGDSVTFEVEGVEGVKRAKVYAVEPSVDPSTRTVPMRGTSPNPGGALLPGAFATVTLKVREVADALTVPSIAVISELGGKKVFVVEEGTAQPRQVVTGIRTGDRVQIVRGLLPGDRVIVSGLQMVRPGAAVEIEGESPSGGET